MLSTHFCSCGQALQNATEKYTGEASRGIYDHSGAKREMQRQRAEAMMNEL